MAGSRDSTSLELSPAAAAIIASAAKELAEQQSMNEALESQIQEGVQELLRIQSELSRIHSLRQVIEEKLRTQQFANEASGDGSALES